MYKEAVRVVKGRKISSTRLEARAVRSNITSIIGQSLKWMILG